MIFKRTNQKEIKSNLFINDVITHVWSNYETMLHIIDTVITFLPHHMTHYGIVQCFCLMPHLHKEVPYLSIHHS